MIPNFNDHPGYYFVAATLLPLASFLLIFLYCGAWALARRYQQGAEGPEGLYRLLDSPGMRRMPAYLALGSIALAFVLSLTGFVTLNRSGSALAHEFQDTEHRIHQAEDRLKEVSTELDHARQEQKQAAGEDAQKAAAEVARLEKEAQEQERAIASEREHLARLPDRQEADRARWKGSFAWLQVSPSGLNDPDRATTLRIGYSIDNLAALMFVMVTFVATLIHLFSMGYMSDEQADVVEDHQVHTDEGHLHRRGGFGRFFMYLSLFCFSMLNLVLADNLFQVFVSWELVGICSYLLVGFYFERTSASNAANKAFITNRVGDAGFIIGLLILWSYVGTFTFDDIFNQVRSPLKDADGEELARAGQIVRGDWKGEPDQSGRRTLEVKERDQGSVVVLFPAKPIMDHDHRTHFHGVDSGSTVKVAPDPRPDQFGAMPYWLLVVAGLGIFLGCVGKSAQFPLHVWLPDAMEGPTPVSALIHAATMVAAGVYLVGRCFPLFAPEVLLTIAYTGAITLFMAASIAVVMTDIKKVLAYSTVSQLGYMMLALGVGGWVAGLFHLVTHAVFKALLFLGSGSVIHGCHHEQEMTKYGGLYPKMKVTALTMLMGVLAICGIPGFSGWYSKDAVLAQAGGFARVHPQHMLLFLLPLVGAGFTAFYMFRMWLMTFTGRPRDHHVYDHAHESPRIMTVPLVALAVLSVCVGWGWPMFSAKFPFLDATSSALEHNIHQAQPVSVLADFGAVPEYHEVWPREASKPVDMSERHWAHELHDVVGWVALAVVGVGITFAFLLYYYPVFDPNEAAAQVPRLHAFLRQKWNFDEFYSAALVRPSIVVARSFRRFDLNVLDGIIHAVARYTVGLARWDRRFDTSVVDGLVNVIGVTCYGLGARLRGVQTGFLRGYVLLLVLAAVGIFVALSYFMAMASAG